MIFIGKTASRLKKITGGLDVAILLILISFSVGAQALDRELASEEITKLESNIRKDPTNAVSGRFLMQHYYNRQMFKDMIRVAQPLQKKLDKEFSVMLVEAYLAESDGASALAIIGNLHSTTKPTVESKTWEARAHTMIAKNAKTDIERMNNANSAIRTIREASDLDPRDEDVYIEWVDILRMFWINHAADAMNVVNLMEQKTGDFESHIPLKCELYTKAALWDQGAVACARAVRANPKDIMSWLYYSEVQSVKVGAEEKKKMLLKLGKEFPNHYQTQAAVAELYFADQDYVNATTQYRKLIELKPSETFNLLRLAQSEFKTKQFVVALETYRKHCKNARMVASEFKDATKQLRSDKNLYKKYETAMLTCR